jgi:long-chain acyl-CoA synthetase
LIITGGVNVYPAEIEETLSHLPGVQHVCVFGREDDSWGQRVCAAAVVDRGITIEDLDRFAHEHLAPFKRPKEFHLVNDLPVGPTGKVLRRQMAEHLGFPPRA